LYNYQRGDLISAQWQKVGLAAATLNITGHTLDLSALMYNVTNSGTGGNAAKLAGTNDAKGNIKASFDRDLPPYSPLIQIVAGASGGGFWGVTADQTRFIAVPIIISIVHYMSELTHELQYSFDVEMNTIQNGQLMATIYPPLG
jgi:hypothetical protein